MKIGDKFVDFGKDLEMIVAEIETSRIVCIPARLNFDGTVTDLEYFQLIQEYGRVYTDIEFVKAAVDSFEDDCTK